MTSLEFASWDGNLRKFSWWLHNLTLMFNLFTVLSLVECQHKFAASKNFAVYLHWFVELRDKIGNKGTVRGRLSSFRHWCIWYESLKVWAWFVECQNKCAASKNFTVSLYLFVKNKDKLSTGAKKLNQL